VTEHQGGQPTYAPAAPHAWIAAEFDETVPVRRSEIKRFADEVIRIVQNPLENASSWAWGLAGIAATALLSLVAIASTETHPMSRGVAILHFSMLIGCGIGSAFAFWVNSKQKETQMDRAKRLADEICEVDRRAPHSN
jgi:hypothetical protein